MAVVPLTLPPDYWQNFSVVRNDLDFINNHLFENEVPLNEAELVPILVAERIRDERDALTSRQKSSGRFYLPADEYHVGEKLVFPALDWKKGKVIGVRSGLNSTLDKFDVIDVEFEDGNVRQFAAGLADHKLNRPVEISADDQLLNAANVLTQHGLEIEHKLTEALTADMALVQVAGRWFPRALLVDVNVGNLNLAEAVLDEAGGKPLSTAALLEQVELPANVNPKLIEFSLNYALQEDGRFDEVGPAGEVLWFLKRLEPEDVRLIPLPLRYMSIPYDRAVLTREMVALEAETDDELAESEPPSRQMDEVVISLSYPHWRAGTLPVSARVRNLLPTAYYTPRVRFTLVDGLTHEEIPAWVVRQHGYVVGLHEFYKKYNLMPGSLVSISRGKKHGQVVITARVRRPMRDYVRTVLAGSDGRIVFATTKQNITSEFNERMFIYVLDVSGVDEASSQMAAQHLPFEQMVTDMMNELIKLNVQGHVHAQELYSALNIVRRCPPGPLLAYLASEPMFKHVGDMHFRMAESEAEDE